MNSAVLGSYFLNERLGTLGKLGCAMCLLGSVVIVLHAPPDKPVESIEEILGYALSPGNGTSEAAISVVDAQSKKLVQHAKLGAIGVKSTAQGMVILV